MGVIPSAYDSTYSYAGSQLNTQNIVSGTASAASSLLVPGLYQITVSGMATNSGSVGPVGTVHTLRVLKNGTAMRTFRTTVTPNDIKIGSIVFDDTFTFTIENTLTEGWRIVWDGINAELYVIEARVDRIG